MMKLTTDDLRELEDIVAFTTKAGDRIFYSKLSSIEGNTFTYGTEVYTVGDEQSLRDIKDGLLRYETYKLTMTRSNAEKLLNTKAEEVIERHYTKRFDKMLSIFKSTIYNLELTLNSSADIASSTSKDLATITDKVTKLSETITKTTNELDHEAIGRKLKAKLDAFSDLKDDLTNQVRPITTQVSSLISKLEKLVT